LLYSLRGQPEQIRQRMIGSTHKTIYMPDIETLTTPLPALEIQRAIAAFLDAETARIDALIWLRFCSRELHSERFESAVYAAVSSGLRPGVTTAPSGLQWVERIPAHWGTPAVSVNFELALGKMLNAESAAGPAQHPYLRNVNVQWDRIDLADLATMSFDEKEFFRYGLRSGDVLICEGGEVGRAAVWAGEVDNCFFQKAIHRARPRTGASGRYLMYCLRAAAKRSVFSVEGNQSTIVHLTGEQLRAHRFPWPPPDEQRDIVEHLDRLAQHHASITRAIDAHIGLLQERKQALITAAVTGQLDIARGIAEEAS
jgi:type I restriction enzyme S subunit